MEAKGIGFHSLDDKIKWTNTNSIILIPTRIYLANIYLGEQVPVTVMYEDQIQKKQVNAWTPLCVPK